MIGKMKAIDMKELIIAMKELEDERGIKRISYRVFRNGVSYSI